MKEVIAPTCGRENDLVSFLYGELNDVEAQTFQRHVRDCASCNAELAAFRDVRESVVTWRNESLGIISPVSERASRVSQQNPSALAAVREFFKLAPLWMKGAVAFASILFVLFAGLAIARLRNEPPAPIVITQNSNANSEQEFNALVEKRVQEELQRLKNTSEKSANTPEVPSAGDPRQQVASHRNSVASSVPNQKARRPLSKTEREQLASDLRLISGKSDTDLDLLDDRINQ
jgi:anti-sigma factor RsiW